MKHTVQLDAGPVIYDDVGDADGRPIVFVHGYLIGAGVWSSLGKRLADAGYRCLAPQLPLGSHTLPMRYDADLTMEGVASMIIEFCDRLRITRTLLAGVDTGGAISQVVATEYSARVHGLILLSCDAFENFPPPVLDGLLRAAKQPTPVSFADALDALRHPTGRRSFEALAHRDIDELIDQWIEPVLSNPAIAGDLRRFTASMTQETTIRAGQRLPGVTAPALVAWSADDAFFPSEDGQRLASALPNCRYEVIPQARTLSMIDQPDALTDLIVTTFD